VSKKSGLNDMPEYLSVETLMQYTALAVESEEMEPGDLVVVRNDEGKIQLVESAMMIRLPGGTQAFCLQMAGPEITLEN